MPPQKLTKSFILQPDIGEVPLTLRRVKGARRLTLRYRPVTRDALLTFPRRVPLAEAVAFAEGRKEWLARVIRAHGARRALADGAVIPVLGAPLTLRHAPHLRGVEEKGGQLHVGGRPEFLARRARDWLKTRLKREIEALARERVAALNRIAPSQGGRGYAIRRITLRDTESRWGSCSADGALSFSWRLVFAPREVLEYLVAHEVAHLAEMNHGGRFWQITARLCPHYEQAQRWLRRHGGGLYHYG